MTGNGVVALLMVVCAVTTAQAADDVRNVHGYGKTTWGMTPDQVLHAEAPGAKKVETPDRFGELIGAIAIDEIQIGTDKCAVSNSILMRTSGCKRSS